MKRNIIFSVILCTLCCIMFGQNSTDFRTERKGTFSIMVGTEYRITPIYGAPYGLSFQTRATNIDEQNSGSSFQYGLKYFPTKNLSLNFMNSIRYDLITLTENNIDGLFGFQAGDRGFIFGFHFFADYHFKVFKKSELFLRLGKSLVNRGTWFSDQRPFFNDQGEVVAVGVSQANFHFQPWNFGLGWTKNKISVVGGVYSSSVTEYLNGGAPFVVPYFNLTYKLFKL